MMLIQSIFVAGIVGFAAVYLLMRFLPKRASGSGCGTSSCNCKAKDLVKGQAQPKAPTPEAPDRKAA